MSNSAIKSSTDEVLASIRRIVRSEQQTGAIEDGGSGARTGSVDVSRGGANAGFPGFDGDNAGGDANAPLALTSLMRLEVSEVQAATEFVAAPAGKSPPTGGDPMRETIRAVLREELASGKGEALVRRIIREELTTGETGDNLSRNVLQLIRTVLDKSAKP